MVSVDVFSDPICPWCFIGKKRLDEALALRPGMPVSIRWRAFQLNPDMPRAGMDRMAYLTAKFGGADRAGEIYAHIRAVGEQVGIPFRFENIPRTPSTLNAHRLIRHAQLPENACADALIPLLFEAYFLEGRDLGDIEVLVDLAGQAGLDPEVARGYLESDADIDEIQAEDVFARRLGIGGVPCFIIDVKYALSGAQEPEAFLPLLDMAMQESTQRPESAHRPESLDV